MARLLQPGLLGPAGRLPWLAALLLPLAAGLGARWGGPRALGIAAAGLGLVAGWALAAGFAVPGLGGWSAAAGLPSRLAPVALAALLAGWAVARPVRPAAKVAATRAAGGRGKAAPPADRRGLAVVLVLALLGGWSLAGGPRGLEGLIRLGWPLAIGAAWISVLVLVLRHADPWRVGAAGLALWTALHAVGAPPLWLLLAAMPGLAALGSLAAPGVVLLPATAGTGAVAAAAVLAAGRLQHFRPRALEAACLAPVATAWAAAWLMPRLRRAGRAAPALAAILALFLVTLAAFMAAALAGLR